MHVLGLEFGSAAQLSTRPGSVWNYLLGNELKRSPGVIRKSRVSYLGPGFLSSATWSSLPKKHYNGLNETKPNIIDYNDINIIVFEIMIISGIITWLNSHAEEPMKCPASGDTITFFDNNQVVRKRWGVSLDS